MLACVKRALLGFTFRINEQGGGGLGLDEPGGRACEYTQRIAGVFAARILEVWRQIDSDNKMEVDTSNECFAHMR